MDLTRSQLNVIKLNIVAMLIQGLKFSVFFIIIDGWMHFISKTVTVEWRNYLIKDLTT